MKSIHSLKMAYTVQLNGNITLVQSFLPCSHFLDTLIHCSQCCVKELVTQSHSMLDYDG